MLKIFDIIHVKNREHMGNFCTGGPQLMMAQFINFQIYDVKGICIFRGFWCSVQYSLMMLGSGRESSCSSQ